MIIFLHNVYPLSVAESAGNFARNLVDADERASLLLAPVSKQKFPGCFNVDEVPRCLPLALVATQLVDVVKPNF